MEIGEIIVYVKNMKQVIAFYRDTLELTPSDPQPFPDAERKFFRFDTGQCKLSLHSASKPNEGRSKLVFHVESVSAKHEELRKKKVRVPKLVETSGDSCFGFKDPEGNRILVWGPY